MAVAREVIRRLDRTELPVLMQDDAEVQESILRMQFAQDRFADQQQTEDRFDRVLTELRLLRKAQDKKWAGRAFRDALAGVLEDSFGVQVQNINEWDDDGIVFGQPDQVEIDVIINNGSLILCELKSSLSKPDMLTFHRKALFYERRHGRKPDRLLAISPMIDDRARQAGERLGIEMYGDSVDVRTL